MARLICNRCSEVSLTLKQGLEAEGVERISLQEQLVSQQARPCESG